MNEYQVTIAVSHNDNELIGKKLWFISQPMIKWVEVNTFAKETSKPHLQITRKGIFLYLEDNEPFFFHPSMALLRLITILQGKGDRYLTATGLAHGNNLLDATLGLGADALIGSWAVGDNGQVIALERSPIITALVKFGLKELSEGVIIPKVTNPIKKQAWQSLAKAAARIKVINSDHKIFLEKQKSHSFDVVYFDPMFRKTREQSSSLRPLHHLSDCSPLERDTINQSIRVAKNRIVMKERKNSIEFERLGFSIIQGGKYSPVDYGIIPVNGGLI